MMSVGCMASKEATVGLNGCRRLGRGHLLLLWKSTGIWPRLRMGREALERTPAFS